MDVTSSEENRLPRDPRTSALSLVDGTIGGTFPWSSPSHVLTCTFACSCIIINNYVYDLERFKNSQFRIADLSWKIDANILLSKAARTSSNATIIERPDDDTTVMLSDSKLILRAALMSEPLSPLLLILLRKNFDKVTYLKFQINGALRLQASCQLLLGLKLWWCNNCIFFYI